MAVLQQQINRVERPRLANIPEDDPVAEKIWPVGFMDFGLGYFDEKKGRVEPGPNPFIAKVLPMCSV